ncbi:SMP-30/gluconolactonase/LRE family protein [Pseudomonas syringae pv. actinidiae]|uniref:Gluconolaconase n=4 Tax=Pseudomonas syringae TaxID=317 RepID=A0A2G9L249_PSESF|nr:SMP-30/gluconolactonase/LRE family protein [Pseudomonas syringae]EPN07830.1 senescence marker protein-30 family protein [Pseudomonas syringae pv. actinidiae ICMP 19070]EPN72340.1 senescence marker protein-30 family protein [Pseudomonas syringae pv. actinidiae ICMP 19101]AKT30617.1 gluconolaconase [Pseudomonas syringae pv. actinidiae ICMP 18884]AOE57043.1 gluconolaconase [Pseudomonas syringae pv. actinidiae ICMP 18708]APP98001.1 gluconolaconase [Pseudomonas syringae pv. actinidiae]
MNWLPVSEHRFKLAEGAFWDAEEQALYWVDIAGFLACRLIAGEYRQWCMPEPVSAFIPTEQGDALVTLASGVYRLDLTAEKTSLSLFCVADPTPGNRANEARCDTSGRLWLGSMQNNIDAEGGDVPLVRRSGGLFRVDADASVTRLLDGQGIVNTLLWNADSSVLYSADTLDEVIYQYPVLADGTLGPRQVWAAEHSRGSPDGSAMDAQGYVWNARWGGSCLIRFAPDGSVDRIVDLPVSHPTSCVFAGPDLQTLYVTSAAPGDAHGQFDGAVLMAHVGVSGKACQRFAG